MDYNTIRYSIIPPLFLIFFTVITQWLVSAGDDNKVFSVASILNTGTPWSWSVVTVFLLWSYLSLIVPSNKFRGPTTPAGYVPVYSANGTQYYLVSLLTYLIMVWCVPTLPLNIWRHFHDIIATLNIFSLLFCLFLLFKGKCHGRDELLNYRIIFHTIRT